MTDNRIYDLEVKCKDGTWMIWETVEGLDNANKEMSAERLAMSRGEIPHAEIRKIKRQQAPEVGQRVFFKPRQPDEFQRFSHSMEAVGEVTGVGRDSGGVFIRVKADHLPEEAIRMKDFYKKGVRECQAPIFQPKK
jgi:hypothetical protein